MLEIKLKNKTIGTKIVSIFVILSMLIQLIIPLVSFGANVNITISTENTELKAGETVYADVYVTGDAISTFSAYIKYDENVFDTIKASSIILPDVLLNDDDIWTKSYTAANGKVLVGSDSGDCHTIPNGGLLFSIELKVLKDTDSSTIKLTTLQVDTESGRYREDEVSGILPKAAVTPTTYTITYTDPSGDSSVTGMPSAGTKNEGTAYTIAAGPTRANYTFAGWNTQADGSGTTYAVGASYTTEADLDLYAQWTPTQYTLTINAGTGKYNGSTTATESGTAGSSVTISNPTAPTTPVYTVQYNMNNGGTVSPISSQIQPSFDKWTKTSGQGSLSTDGTSFTFGAGNATITASYKHQLM